MADNGKMRDGLVQKGRRWYYVIRVRDPQTDRTKAVWRGGFDSRAEAKVARDEARHRANTGTWVEPSRVTLADYLRGWLEFEESQVRPTTLRSYTMHVRQHIVPELGGHRLQTLTPSHISVFYGRLLKSGRVQTPRTGKSAPGGLSVDSVRRIHATLHRALNRAVKERVIHVNPASEAELPKVDDHAYREVGTWTMGELVEFLDATRHHELFAVYHVAAWTGLRRGELCGLKWRDVDLEGGKLTVRRSRAVVGKQVVEGPPKTHQARRTVTFLPETAQVLREQHKRQAARKLALAGEGEGFDYVFSTQTGGPLHPDYVTRTFAAAVKLAGARRLTFHGLRHTHATLLMEQGVPLKAISDRLGHSTVALTANLYQHVSVGLQEQVAESFGAAMAAAREGKA